jgi:hypothetical protein
VKLRTVLFLLAALLFSMIAHIFEQMSIRAQQRTIVLLESTMKDQTAAIDEQNRAIGMCRDAMRRADQVTHDQNATLVSCAENERRLVRGLR